MAFPRNPEHFWPVLWGGAALALVAVLVLERQYGRSTAEEGPRAPARVAEAKLLPPFRLADAQAGGETLARPLFVPGRRPSPPATAEAGKIKRGQFLLQGTTLVGSLHIAFLKELSSGTVHRVEKGGEIKGMKLEEVSAEEVVLKAGDDVETLPLVVAKAAGTPATAAAAVERGPFSAPEAPPKAAEPADAAKAAAPAAAAPATGTVAPAKPAAGPATSGGRLAAPRSRLTAEEIAARRANRATPTPRTPSTPAPGAQPQN
jgi:pyruvate dehydrogenase E2 component (dihydrolipoamide acetyltransferase)